MVVMVMVWVLGWQTEVVSRCWPLYLKAMAVIFGDVLSATTEVPSVTLVLSAPALPAASL